LDGQLLAGEDAEVRQHVRSCVVCAARQEEIRRALDTVTDALQQTDARPQRSRARSIRWPVAIAAGVLLALTLGVAPVRGWILRLPKTVWQAIAPGQITTPIVPDTSLTAQPDVASVSFVPPAAVFVIEVTTMQSHGSLTIQVVDHDTATATVVGKGDTEEIIVLPSGFRIVNAPGSTATYTVQLPASLDRIRVVVAGQPAIVLDLSAERREWVVPLVEQ
jgi:hypothetical protein